MYVAVIGLIKIIVVRYRDAEFRGIIDHGYEAGFECDRKEIGKARYLQKDGREEPQAASLVNLNRTHAANHACTRST
jgi:hypothetical protein